MVDDFEDVEKWNGGDKETEMTGHFFACVKHCKRTALCSCVDPGVVSNAQLQRIIDCRMCKYRSGLYCECTDEHEECVFHLYPASDMSCFEAG